MAQKRSQQILTALLLLLIAVGVGFAKRTERLITNWRPLNYDVSLILNERLTEITKATTRISIVSQVGRLAEVDLDFGALSVESVQLGDSKVNYEHANGRLLVKLPTPVRRGDQLTLTVVYRGVPKDGLIMSVDKSGYPSAVGDNWPNRVHHWIPSLDHPSAKATVKFTVTAPERSLVVANGRLDQVQTTANGTRTWTYNERSPVPPYCMVIAVGEFALLKPDGPTVTPLSYYVPQRDKDVAIHGFAAADPSLKLFSETIAPYPYEKLALIVGATRFGGMENSGAIVFASNLFEVRAATVPMSRVFNVRLGLVTLIAHEVAHQWFGDSVTGSTWSDLWLSEGFATYFAALFIQRHEGEEAFRAQMNAAKNTYVNSSKGARKPLFDDETENLMSLLNANSYQKGAWVLHMLRKRLGDEVFYKGLRNYYRKHQHATASSEDLRAALEQTSGTNLKEFFARWVYAGGHPEYEVAWNWQRRVKSGLLTLSIKQTQPEPYFSDSLTVEIDNGRTKQRTIVRPTGRESIIRLAVATKPKSITIDPDDAILKELRTK